MTEVDQVAVPVMEEHREVAGMHVVVRWHHNVWASTVGVYSGAVGYMGSIYQKRGTATPVVAVDEVAWWLMDFIAPRASERWDLPAP